MRSLVAILTLALTLAATAAHAQEAAPMLPAPPIPPPLVVPPPPVAVLPPAPPPWAATQAGKALEQRGHVEKVVGAVLMGVGAAAVVSGIVLSALDSTCGTRTCANHGPLVGPGLGLELVGGAAFAAGIPTYIVGGVQVDRGRRLALTGFGAAPTLGANGVSGGMASASFRF